MAENNVIILSKSLPNFLSSFFPIKKVIDNLVNKILLLFIITYQPVSPGKNIKKVICLIRIKKYI